MISRSSSKAGDRQGQEQEAGGGRWLVGADTKTLQDRWDTDLQILSACCERCHV